MRASKSDPARDKRGGKRRKPAKGEDEDKVSLPVYGRRASTKKKQDSVTHWSNDTYDHR